VLKGNIYLQGTGTSAFHLIDGIAVELFMNNFIVHEFLMQGKKIWALIFAENISSVVQKWDRNKSMNVGDSHLHRQTGRDREIINNSRHRARKIWQSELTLSPT
jgi:hypothetical protein